MKKLFVVLLVVFVFAGCSQIRDGVKNLESNTVGLDRDIFVTVDDGTTFVYSGRNIRVSETEYGNKVIVTVDGKRLAIYNASVQVIENGLEPKKIYAPGELAEIK